MVKGGRLQEWYSSLAVFGPELQSPGVELRWGDAVSWVCLL